MTTRNMNERLMKEIETNVGLKVEMHDSQFMVSGRGELHLSVLIESIRREGRELQVGSPQVIFKMVDGQKQEPIENVIINIDDKLASTVIDKLNQRK